jgi:hypothetical protein
MNELQFTIFQEIKKKCFTETKKMFFLPNIYTFTDHF